MAALDAGNNAAHQPARLAHLATTTKVEIGSNAVRLRLRSLTWATGGNLHRFVWTMKVPRPPSPAHSFSPTGLTRRHTEKNGWIPPPLVIRAFGAHLPKADISAGAHAVWLFLLDLRKLARKNKNMAWTGKHAVRPLPISPALPAFDAMERNIR
jgi:hypothetical protein